MRCYSLLVLLFVFRVHLIADQPIFNEMPRWDDGWGFQFVHEFRHEEDLMSGDEVLAEGFSEDIHLLHLEGVYTWDKTIRLTAKLPYVLDARRELLDSNGGKFTQSDNGLGDLTLALPLKKYFNLDGRTGSWTIAPQARIPLAGDDAYEVYNGIWGTGLSFGYETETYDYLFHVGLSSWIVESGEPYELSGSLDLGLNYRIFETAGHVKWETDFIYKDDGTEKLYVGPKVYLRVTDLVHAQMMYKQEVHSRRNAMDHGNSSFWKAGVGFVF